MLNRREAKGRMSSGSFADKENWKSTGGTARRYINEKTGETVSRRTYNEVIRGQEKYEAAATRRAEERAARSEKSPNALYKSFVNEYRQAQYSKYKKEYPDLKLKDIHVRNEEAKKAYKAYKIMEDVQKGKKVSNKKKGWAIKELYDSGIYESPEDYKRDLKDTPKLRGETGGQQTLNVEDVDINSDMPF